MDNRAGPIRIIRSGTLGTLTAPTCARPFTRSMGGMDGHDDHDHHGNSFYGPGSAKYSMTGFGKDEANWVTGGGTVIKGSIAEFNDQLKRAEDNFNEGSAVTTKPSLTILRPYQ